jgi:hypothetical protein
MYKIYFKNKGCTRKANIPNRLNCEYYQLTRDFWHDQEGQLVCLIDPIQEDKKYWRANMQIVDSTGVRYQTYRNPDVTHQETCYWSQLAYLELNSFSAIFTQRVNYPLHDIKDSANAHRSWEHLCAIPHIFRAAVDELQEWFPNTNKV